MARTLLTYQSQSHGLYVAPASLVDAEIVHYVLGSPRGMAHFVEIMRARVTELTAGQIDWSDVDDVSSLAIILASFKCHEYDPIAADECGVCDMPASDPHHV